MFNKKNKITNTNCPLCNSCGDLGRCEPTGCTNHPKGYYCDINMDELIICHNTLIQFWKDEDNTKVDKKLIRLYRENTKLVEDNKMVSEIKVNWFHRITKKIFHKIKQIFTTI